MNNRITLLEELRLYIGAYYGVDEMDEYGTKVYVLKEIEEYIKDFIRANPSLDCDYEKEREEIENLPLKRKLQDSLYLLHKMNAPFDLILLIKKRLKNIED